MAPKHDWLTAASFEQAHEIASAIDTLSIHAKLLLNTIEDPTPVEDVQRARERLRRFLRRLEAVLADAERNGAVLGADPQMVDVALAFLARQRRGTAKRETPRLAELPTILESERPVDLRRLVTGLQELRSLLDVHAPSEPVQLVAR